MSKISTVAKAKIKEFEGFRSTAYLCPAGKWTIGYGHTSLVKRGDKVNAEQADVLLEKDILIVETAIKNLHLPLNTQGKWDAVVDWCFNLGKAKLITSTLYKKIKSKAPDAEIQAEFRRWVYAKVGGKSVKMPGLIKRREWEAKRWIEE